MTFQQWLKTQYGPGTAFSSARQLSLAISEGKNAGAVADLENRGLSRLDTAAKLAEATSTSLLEVLVMSGYVPEEQLKGKVLSDEEQELLQGFRQLPHQGKGWILGSLRGMLDFAGSRALETEEARAEA